MDSNEKLNDINNLFGEIAKDNDKFQSSFMNFVGNVLTEGALDVKTKELIIISLSMASRCEWCISYHVFQALKAGATKKELMEVGYVTTLMYGSQALMEMNNLIDAINQFENQK